MAELLSWARFDDLVTGRALLFSRPGQILAARTGAQVAPVLRAVDALTRRGAWAYGYLAYEAAGGLDPDLPVHALPAGAPPLAWFAVCAAPRRVDPIEPFGRARGYQFSRWQPAATDARYRAAIERVRAHIAAGEVYQCNLTARLAARLTGDPLQMYADLARNQGGHHAAFLDLGTHTIASASPELFFEWVGDELLTRPMKGTALRGRTLAEDEQRRADLVASPKERAENIMIVDLLRNDVGRLAETGSVRVPQLCVAERYETLWQLTSQVTGRLPGNTGLLDVFRALFPSGSVTGAPKQRAMAIIRDLEETPRGVYCGAIGMLAPFGEPCRARFAVGIRTVVTDRSSGCSSYGTGGGITWDSVPDLEVAEAQHKAAILLTRPRNFELFETMAYLPGSGLRQADRHLRRLADSAAYFGYPFDARMAGETLAAALAGAGAARVRLTLARSGAIGVELGALPERATRPVALAIDGEPVDSGQCWLYHKTSNRDVYTSRAARHPDADDVVLVNERAEVTETTVANVAVHLDGTWWTPPCSAGCLPGVERGRLVELGELRERTLRAKDLVQAERLALVSSLRGWRSAVLIEPARRDW